MNESAFRSRFRQEVLLLDPAAVVRINESRWTAGFPDLTVVSRGRVAFVELKVHRKHHVDPLHGFTVLQLRTLNQLARAGADAFGAVLELRNPQFLGVPRVRYWRFTGSGTPVLFYLPTCILLPAPGFLA